MSSNYNICRKFVLKGELSCKPIHSINALDRLLVTTQITTLRALSKSSRDGHLVYPYFSFIQIGTLELSFTIHLYTNLYISSVFVIIGRCHMIAEEA